MRTLDIKWLPRLLAMASAIAFGLGSQTAQASASTEMHFDTLTIGTHTYSNVTVTTKNKNYVFFHHSTGMMNVKVAELSLEEKENLGYEQKKPATNQAATWAKNTLTKIETPQVKELEKKFQAARGGTPPDIMAMLKPMISAPIAIMILALFFAAYLFASYCCMLICKKAGTEPGFLVWLPVLQMFPLLKAAKMSPVWFIASLLPILNIIAHLVWCIKIAEARGKSFWTAICLILPITNIFAFLYLAFSNGVEEHVEAPKRPEMMVLGTA